MPSTSPIGIPRRTIAAPSTPPSHARTRRSRFDRKPSARIIASSWGCRARLTAERVQQQQRAQQPGQEQPDQREATDPMQVADPPAGTVSVVMSSRYDRSSAA